MNPDLLASPSSDSSRFHEILKNLTESDEGKLHILKVVYDVWRNHPQVQTHRTTSNRRGSDLKHFSHSVMETMLMFLGVFLCKNVHLECGVWRNVSLLHDRWSQCWWTKWFGRRLLTVPLLLTGSSLKIWPMSSPGEMWEINSTSVLFLIRGYKKLCNVFVYILWIVCFLSGSLLKILSYPHLDFSSGRFCTRPSGRWTNMSRRSSRSWRRPRINWKNSSTRG